MRIISVGALRGGEILAEPIMNEQKNVVIPDGTKIKEEYIPLIQTFGVETIAIQDPYEMYEEPHLILSPCLLESLIERVRSLMEKHIYHSGSSSLREFEIIANEVVREVNKISEDTIIDIHERTSNLYEHTVMVTLLSTMVAKSLRLDKKKQYNIAVGCLLHDIGLRYITVPYEDCNIESADMASVFEYKKHTIMGYSAVEEENWIPAVSRKMILSHHEKIDGSGFPMHQKIKEVECKIIQICDFFDCQISGMECKRTSVQSAIEYLQSNAGIMYDENIVNQFVSMIAKYPVGTTVKTNEEKQGVVISQTKDPGKPIIMIIDAKDDTGRDDEKYNLMIEEHISILHVV